MGIRIKGLRALAKRPRDEEHHASMNYWRQLCAQVGCSTVVELQSRLLLAGYYVAYATLAAVLRGASIPDLRTRVAFANSFDLSTDLKLQIYEYGVKPNARPGQEPEEEVHAVE